jgi:hypothetical protein
MLGLFVVANLGKVGQVQIAENTDISAWGFLHRLKIKTAIAFHALKRRISRTIQKKQLVYIDMNQLFPVHEVKINCNSPKLPAILS